MQRSRRPARLLIYSHDTFGLGHLRRCRTIAHALVARRKKLSVLILSGSPIIGSFNFKARVDFVRVPGVIKLRNGEYSSLSLHMDVAEVLDLRASIIRHTAEAYDPDVFLVDKEPLGLRGEIADTLPRLRERGTRIVLGLRDVLDDPELLLPEWERKGAVDAIKDHYDDVLVYGLPEIHDPLNAVELPPEVRERVHFTGYLRSSRPARNTQLPEAISAIRERYVLVTPGGGGDGENLIDWVLSAYEHDPGLPQHAVIVFGPFMAPAQRRAFRKRVAALRQVHALTFEAGIERLLERSAGMVAMGGYNTFCDMLSFDKPAVLVPRRVPRREQLIRAERASALGLCRMLDDSRGRDPAAMAAALRGLVSQARPSEVGSANILGGLEAVHNLMGEWLARPQSRLRRRSQTDSPANGRRPAAPGPSPVDAG